MSAAERRRLQKERETKARTADFMAKVLKSILADVREIDAQLEALSATTPEARRALMRAV